MSEVQNDRSIYDAPDAELTTAQGDEGFDETSPFSPSGRLGRIRYLAYMMLSGVAFGVAMIAILAVGVAISGDDLPGIVLVVAIPVYIAWFAMMFILQIKRLHDQDRTGWFSILSLVPVANFVLGLILMFSAGTATSNRYGPPPRAPGRATTAVVIGALVLIFPIMFGAIITTP